MVENKALSAFLGLSKKLKMILAAVAVLGLVAVVICLVGIGHNGGVTTVSEASLREIIDINELSTVEYDYNAIATKYDDEQTKPLYHVAYKGKVTAGIDFSKIKVDIDKTNKHIIITIPDAEVHHFTVDVSEMDYIFVKDKYETEDISKEAYSLCLADLEESLKEQDNLLSFAKENAQSTIEALLGPWLDSLKEEYKIVYSEEEPK